MHDVGNKPRERAIVVGVVRKGADPAVTNEHLTELELLLDTAGADVVERVTQERERPDVATALGRGKVEELKQLLEEKECPMVVFDDELSPVQVRNLEKALEVKVLDRSGVILDIFASHARSVEARTQVELAQLEYLFPRLSRMWTHLSKQFGGVGTKGPGETQIETDRRMYRTRMVRLRERLREIDVQRLVQRKGREGLPRFALVGYTNAGKSSLMRSLTMADVYIEDKLFATLDTTVRAMGLPGGQKALISDTVGFIRKLPAQLVASFRTTLAETLEADVLLHVVDISHEGYRDHIATVQETLRSLGAESKPTLLLFNKIDAVEDRNIIEDAATMYPGSLFVSAARNLNIQTTLARMEESLENLRLSKHLLIPYERMQDVAKLYTETEILHRADTDRGVVLVVRVTTANLPQFTARYGAFVTDPFTDTTEPPSWPQSGLS